MVLAVSEQKLTQIRQETDNDESLKMLKSVIMKGWPETRSELNTKVQDFLNFREELSVYSDIIFKEERIVIPMSMTPEMLEKVHESHLGI